MNTAVASAKGFRHSQENCNRKKNFVKIVSYKRSASDKQKELKSGTSCGANWMIESLDTNWRKLL